MLHQHFKESLVSRKRKLDFDENDSDVTEIFPKKHGRPFLVGNELDSKLQKYLYVLRENGAVINTQIVIAAGKGIITGKDNTLLSENDGHLDLTKSWAKSLLQRMNFVKRRGSTACKNDKVENFEELKNEFLERIEKTVTEYDIPSDLIINWDHAGLNIVPVSNWTMASEGSKRVEIAGLGDKRQITAVFAGTLSGKFLPPQVIYAGKTEKCHPSYNFPTDWHITHSENHWANANTQMEYIKKKILPYISQIKRKENLPKGQKALCIFDVFRARMGKDFLEFLAENNIKVVFVPTCCKDRLQPLGVSVQKAVKNHLRKSFEDWYSNQIVAQLKDGEDSDVSPVDLTMSKLKPLSAKWLVQMYQHISNSPDIIRNGFKETGIANTLKAHLEDEIPLAGAFTK